MSGARILFVRREAIVAPAVAGRDSVGPFDASPLRVAVIPALSSLRDAGFGLVLVSTATERDAPATDRTREGSLDDFVLRLLESQGVAFEAVPRFAAARHRGGSESETLEAFLTRVPIDPRRSAVVGTARGDDDFAHRLGIEYFAVGDDPSEAWPRVATRARSKLRSAAVHRETRETKVRVEVALDVASPIDVHTGIGFFDHMLEQIAKHGGFSLQLSCAGDLHVDEHHTVEDTALALGQALREALGDKRGIERYGFVLPMDEAEAHVSIDLAGRPYAVFDGTLGREVVGRLPTELIPHFFRSFADTLGAALHVRVTGSNSHHMIESCFKGVGRALRSAIHREGIELPSSKGVL